MTPDQRYEIIEAIKAYGRAMRADSETTSDKLNTVRDLLDKYAGQVRSAGEASE